MSDKKKPTAWRCKTIQQQRDKAEIYNSREWQQLRIEKLRSQPLCEMHLKQGIIVAARCVHHIVPIETATTKEQMRVLAFCRNLPNPLNGLMSLCYDCHAKIHKEMGSNTKAKVAERAEARQARWKDSLLSRFTNKKDNGIQTEIHAGPIREQSTDRDTEAKAQTNSKGYGGSKGDMG